MLFKEEKGIKVWNTVKLIEDLSKIFKIAGKEILKWLT